MKPKTAEALFAGWPAEAAGMAGRVREVVLEVCPQASERVYAGWNIVGYSLHRHPTWGMFCYVGLSGGKVSLGFNEGVVLPDPQRLLRGRAKRARSLRLEPGAPLPEAAVRELVGAAYAYALFRLEGSG